jgi:hypothetical protein
VINKGTTMNYGDMILTVELFTPAYAQAVLNTTNTKNRRIRPAIVAQYARDMLAGKWVRKPVAICFNKDGLNGNGQHTLNAIVQSGCAQELLVARNCSDESIAIMDQGLRRTISDVSHFVGVDLSSREASVVRVVKFGPSDVATRSFAELFDLYMTHREMITWVCGISPRRAGFSASTLAVMVRAAYTRDIKRIDRFAEVLRTGVVESECDTAAIRLRDYCARQRGGGGMSLRVDIYRRSQSALHSFLQHKPMSKLYGTESEFFPLPGAQ